MLGYEYRVVTCLIVFPVHLQAGKANLGLSGVYIGTKRLSGVISEPKKPHFLTFFFGTKRNFFQPKRSFLSWEHLVNSFERQSCVVEHHLGHTVKLRSVLVQTSTHQETQFFEVFWLNTQLFSCRNAVFIVATPCKSNWTAILWFWASRQSHSKISKRYSADHNTPKHPIFWYNCLAQTATFCQKSGHFYYWCTFHNQTGT